MDRLLEATRRAEREHFWFRGFRRFVRPLLEQATAGLTGPILVDCGCGTGANLAMLGRHGRAYGFDLSWTGLRYTSRDQPGRVLRATVTHLPFGDARVDVVTSFDVIYALEDADARRAMAEMFRVLKPGGWAIINTAALDILKGYHSELGHEVRRYTRLRLRALVEGTGFKIARLTYTNATLFPMTVLVRLSQRLLGPPPEERADTDMRVPPAPLNALLSGVLAVESLALRLTDMPVGSSLLCLARKSVR